MSDLNPNEQYLLELINRARSDPGAEAARLGISLNQGLASGSIQDTAKQPLAANEFLNNAAADHSKWMLATNIFSHTGQGGSSAGDRIEDAGYTNWRTWGENISYRGGGNVQSVAVVEGHHDGLFKSAGHRRNLMNDGFTEIGIGQEYGRFNNFNASMLTEKFASDRGDPFLLGVVFDDQDGDDFFDPGEELSDVRVTVSSEGATFTGDGGGYEIRVDGGGTFSVTFSGGGLDGSVTRTVQIGAENVKLDLNIDGIVADMPPPPPPPADPEPPEPEEPEPEAPEPEAPEPEAPAQPSDPEPETPVADGPAPDDDTSDAPDDDAGPDEPGGDDVANDDGPDDDNPAPAPQAPRKVTGGAGNDRMIGGDEDEIMAAGRGADIVRGRGGDDHIRGQAGDDRLIGGAGDDTLKGGGGADRLIGNGGEDQLRGGGGADTLKGGREDDVLTGNGGADVFQFGARHGDDVVTDFQLSRDRIEILSGADEFAKLTLSQSSDGAVVVFGAASVLLSGVSDDDLTASHFIF